MISFFEADIESVSVHRVGNKLQDEYFSLSDEPLKIVSPESSYLMHYFLSPFEKQNEVFTFYHPSGDVRMNDVAFSVLESLVRVSDSENLVKSDRIHARSQDIAIHLYDTCNHPKIKGGELYVVRFNNIQFEGELVEAIGLFKSDTKDTFMKVEPTQTGFSLSFENDAVNIHKLDKGALILNTGNDGLQVLCLDSGKDSSYWKDEFLGLQVRNDDYTKTSNILNVCKNFILDELDQHYDISSSGKIDLLNNSIKYFKDKEAFDLEEFSETVIGNKEAATKFKEYVSIYSEEFDADIPECFDISTAAVKKQAKSFKKILKLDKNFHVYIHGSKDLVEKGYDEDKGMNFYKLYFKDEQ